MDKYILDERSSLWYELINDYYFFVWLHLLKKEQPVSI